MQVYRHMDIGSAKVTKEEMEGIPHYLIDVLDPQDDFNVVTFQTMAKQAMNEIYSHNKIPIITGGTGFISRLCFMILILKKMMRKILFVKS